MDPVVVAEEYNGVNPDGNLEVVESVRGLIEILLPVVHEATINGKAYSLSRPVHEFCSCSGEKKQSLDPITRANNRQRRLVSRLMENVFSRCNWRSILLWLLSLLQRLSCDMTETRRKEFTTRTI